MTVILQFKKCHKEEQYGNAWVIQLVKYLTLGFGSGHDLTVRGFEPHIGLCADSVEPAWDSQFPSLSLSLSLKNRQINIGEKKE